MLKSHNIRYYSNNEHMEFLAAIKENSDLAIGKIDGRFADVRVPRHGHELEITMPKSRRADRSHTNLSTTPWNVQLLAVGIVYWLQAQISLHTVVCNILAHEMVRWAFVSGHIVS